jgi:glycine/D-amino acid oxidase-like deaminating enzyme
MIDHGSIRSRVSTTPRPDPVDSDERLPDRAAVVVIGGGIIGTSTTLALADKGIDVVLCEKGAIGAEQSSRNWGWCRTQGRDPREIQLSLEANRIWQGLNAKVQGETGFRAEGVVYLCSTESDLAYYEAWLEKARIYQVDARMLSSDQVAKLLPGATRRWLGGIYSPSAGRAEPQRAAPAIANGARRLGATILTRCAVRGLEKTAGRVSAVVTETGRIATDTVVLAGGAWSRLFCGNHGIDLPQLKVRGSVMRTSALDGVPVPSVAGRGFAFRRRLDGGYTVANRGWSVAEIVPDSFRLFFKYMPALRVQWKDLGFRIGERFLSELGTPRRWSLDSPSPFEAERTLDPRPDTHILEAAKKRLEAAFPVFAGAKVLDQWAGLIDVTPDVVPVIGPVQSLPGFYIATGFSGHGFGIGPAAGQLMADLITGGRPLIDPKPLRFERFTDGSPLVIN